MPAPVVVTRWPTPTKGDIQLQFSSIELGIAGHSFRWVSEISYEMNVERGEARGTSPFVMGVTLGELKANASITIQRKYRERFLNFVEQGVPGFMDKFFPISVGVQEKGWAQVETDSFVAMINGMAHDYSAGNNVLMTKIPLWTPVVSLNGHVPFDGVVV